VSKNETQKEGWFSRFWTWLWVTPPSKRKIDPRTGLPKGYLIGNHRMSSTDEGNAHSGTGGYQGGSASGGYSGGSGSGGGQG